MTPLNVVNGAGVEALAPGSVIGILGGGQLGRMLVLAAARLGYACHVFAPDADSPASHVTDRFTCAAYDNAAALRGFACSVDVCTYEFENVPAEAAATVSAFAPLRPGADVLAVCQDRVREKTFLRELGVPVAPFFVVSSPDDMAKAVVTLGLPAVLKSARMGYDGKGQGTIRAIAETEVAWQALCRASKDFTGVLEAWVDFTMEISVVVARGADGETAAYVPVQNIHEHHILRRTIAPAPIPPSLADEATSIAAHLAEKLDLIGVLCVEMFVTRDGQILINELAPRPHNSGHWTIDACASSQFEQCVRAIVGLPLGSTERHLDAVMENLLGDEVEGWRALAAQSDLRVHLYGKREARAGRKMGHVTRLIRRP